MARDWFDAATWPLEAAVVWVATGNRRLSAGAMRLALTRRDCPKQRLPSLGMWLVINEGLARELESVGGALYRQEMRQGWTPGRLNQRHPFDLAMVRTRQLLIGRHTTGRQGASPRASIPGVWWKAAILIDDRTQGMLARSRPHNAAAWQEIDVPAAVFRGLRAKRGRRPAGLSESPRAIHYSKKTEERLKRKKVIAAK